jgi:uncharacterized protein (TIGR02599 family)
MKRGGFTLVEVLVACAVLMILMAVLAGLIGVISRTWTGTRGKIEQFQQARAAFEALSASLTEATLNPVLEYVDQDGNYRDASDKNFVPARYVRRSDLRFLSGPSLTGKPGATTHAVFFQTPQGVSDTIQGLDQLLNTCGFFVELGDDANLLPTIVPSSQARTRFRLLQLVEPTENLSVYSSNGTAWFSTALADDSGISVAAENIIALVLLPKLSKADLQEGGYTDTSLAPNYTYDSNIAKATPALNSRHQLPPVVQATMVAIDETSAARMTTSQQAELKTLLDGLFQTAGSTTDPNQAGLAKDLKTLEDYLNAQRITYRIFTSNIALKAAKWSREQAN